jgi:hypothetical protein
VTRCATRTGSGISLKALAPDLKFEVTVSVLVKRHHTLGLKVEALARSKWLRGYRDP